MAKKEEVPKISDAEWIVMRVFWSRGELTSGDVVEELEKDSDWKPKTIQTLIRRLVQKGALDFEKQGREYLYRPAVTESACEQAASRQFLDRVFDGKMAPFLATFVESANYSDEDIAELKRILNESTNDGTDT